MAQKQLFNEDGTPQLLFGLPIFVDDDMPAFKNEDLKLLPFDEGIERFVAYPNPLKESDDAESK